MLTRSAAASASAIVKMDSDVTVVDDAHTPVPPPKSIASNCYFSMDRWIELAEQCLYLPEGDVKALCDIVMDRLVCESNVVEVQTPVTICGDLHGQFYDVRGMFALAGGAPPHRRYVMMGDFVDRGHYSLETITWLLALKARYPDHMTLIRGNHETRGITQTYGFYDECLQKYGSASVWQHMCRVFDLLPIACVVDDTVLCVHGGLSPMVKTLDAVMEIPREQDVPHQGAFCDLLWSDPEEIDAWALSPRGAGWLFGRSVLERFMHANDLTLLARAHQLVNDGIKYMWNEQLVTVWTAPNYCYRCGNSASVLEMSSASDRKAIIFNAVEDDNRTVPVKNASPYFL